ncbi:hypothetical protein [Maribellus sp. CM-23]|uniref:hypothetical protein n=1 Tax=Maribellus sp. CM-23 TaxID=2781026 RepID=UPI001F18D07A|nr:hypothetical protein [Maribellus sp. CM-23]
MCICIPRDARSVRPSVDGPDRFPGVVTLSPLQGFPMLKVSELNSPVRRAGLGEEDESSSGGMDG